MDIKRQSDEELIDYRIRICSNKDVLGMTWEQVTSLINQESGENVGESAVRKWWNNFQQGMEYANERKAASDGNLDEFTLKKIELQKERNKLQTEKNELNKWVREQARTENIYEKVERAIESLSPIDVPSKQHVQALDAPMFEMTVDIADAHYGREGTIYGLNDEVLAEYSPEIFEKRMWELLDWTVEIARKEDIYKVHVLNLGDSIDGLLRASQLQTLRLGVLDQTMQFAEFISNWLNELSKKVIVEYHSTLGNHSETRALNSKSGEFQHENMERVITWFVKERLKDNPNVTVHDPKVFQVIDVLGTKIAMTHGQNEKNLEASLKDYSMIYGEQIHILKTGHLHHNNNKTFGMSGDMNVEYAQSPSICGPDDYSLKLKKMAHPGSLITIFASGYGKLNTYDIKLK